LVLGPFRVGSLKIQNLFSQCPKNTFENALEFFSLASKGQYFVVCLLINSVLQNPYFDDYGWGYLIEWSFSLWENHVEAD